MAVAMKGGVRVDATARLVCRRQHLFFETDVMITNPSSSIPAMVIPPSSNLDRAALVATTILQILVSSSALQSARFQVEALLRDEFADTKRQIAAERE
jgi:hypothetical protein